MVDPSPGADAPAMFVPAQRTASAYLPRPSRRAHRIRVMRVHGQWTVIEPRPSLLTGVARRLRATLGA